MLQLQDIRNRCQTNKETSSLLARDTAPGGTTQVAGWKKISMALSSIGPSVLQCLLARPDVSTCAMVTCPPWGNQAPSD